MTDPYTAGHSEHPHDPDHLRAQVPGWGVDLDHTDRPSFPRERFDPSASGAHWTLPEDQERYGYRERSIEHARLTPVFGTSVPLHGVSGAIRRFSYERFSEARAAHWLLLLGADRVDAAGSHLRSFVTGRPDNPITETGIGAEVTRHGWSSRIGRSRSDTNHQWMDPILVGAPWALGVGGAAVVVSKTVRAVRSRR